MNTTDTRKLIGITGMLVAVGVIIYLLIDDTFQEQPTIQPPYVPEPPQPTPVTTAAVAEQPTQTQEQAPDPSKVIPLHPIVVKAAPIPPEAPIEKETITDTPEDVTIVAETTPEPSYTIVTAPIQPPSSPAGIAASDSVTVPLETASENEDVLATEETLVVSAIPEPPSATKERFPLQLGDTGEEVVRLQTWLFRKYGTLLTHTGVFDAATLALVQKEFGSDKLSAAEYKKHKMHLHLSKQKAHWS